MTCKTSCVSDTKSLLTGKLDDNADIKTLTNFFAVLFLHFSSLVSFSFLSFFLSVYQILYNNYDYSNRINKEEDKEKLKGRETEIVCRQ